MRTTRMWRIAVAAAAALFVALASLAAGVERAEAQPRRRVTVRVVEVAGDRAYVTPGETAGLRPGTKVQFGRKTFVVVSATATHAAIDLGGASLEEGDRGTARVTAAERAEGKLATPAPLSTFAGQWHAPRHPADAQRPRRVPLGSGRAQGAFRVTAFGRLMAVIPAPGEGDRDEDGGVATLDLGARVHADPWRELPLGADLDAAVLLRLGASRPVWGSRPDLRVRELRLRWGEVDAPLASFGRLRWAASTVGMLDGVRVSTPPLAGLTVAAFGGFVPDPFTGEPLFDASRFGLEVGWQDARSSFRPRAELVARGSRFDGAIDERRLSGSFSITPGWAQVAAFAELSAFDADNPWGVGTVELTTAAVQAGVRRGVLHADVRLDLRQPERSRWLDAALPQSWLCEPDPRPPGTAEPCVGADETRYQATIDAGVRADAFAISAGAAAVTTDGRDEAEELAAFADARVLGILGIGRVEAGVLATRGSFVDTYALRLGAGATLLDGRLDAALSWRGALIDYSASVETWTEHRVGLDLAVTPAPHLDAVLTIETITGPDLDAIAILSTVVWRPL